MAKDKKKKSIKSGTKLAQVMREAGKGANPTDVLGSYTGMAADGGKPEQDADDL